VRLHLIALHERNISVHARSLESGGKKRQPMMVRYSWVGYVVAIAALSLVPDRAFSQTPSSSLMQLESKIPLGDVSGRIDHMAVDLPRRRLFVAELGNDTVGGGDLNEQKVQHVITGLKEPQGVGYVPSSDTLFVANGGDGSVLLFRGADYAAAGRIDLGDDADNIRVDSASNRVYVGYGGGALAVIDPATNGKIADIPLQAHPESFQLARSDRCIFVNVPKAREIAVVDRFASKQTASWPIENGSNFPMALDESSGRVFVAFRNPPQLSVFSVRDGSAIAAVGACGDTEISSSMRSASACTSAAATDTWMCSTRKETPTVARPTSRRYPAHELRCLFPNSTGFSSPLAPIPAHRLPSGYFVQYHQGERNTRC